MNDQRKTVFEQRLEIMEADDIAEITRDMRQQVVEDLVDEYLPPKTYADQWDTQGLYAAAFETLGIDAPVVEWADEDGVDQEIMRERLYEATDKMMAEKEAAFGDQMRAIEKQVLLQTIDGKWREHLLTLEHLRSVVGFRGYAQRDPLNEYKTEGFQLFEGMLDSLRVDVSKKLAQIRPLSEEERQNMLAQIAQQQRAAQAAAQPQPVTEPAAAGQAAPGFVEGRPEHMGQSRSQRSVSLRNGQEVQALPRVVLTGLPVR